MPYCSPISWPTSDRIHVFIRKLTAAVTVWWAIACLILTTGCAPPQNQAIKEAVTDTELPVVIQDGFNIPHFPSARGQLNYAKSGFTSKKEKKAALRAVISLFPNERDVCGQTALSLAYLYLEPDYRFTTALDIRQASNDFSAILKNFSDLPHIQAKAFWYLGWIHTDLLNDPVTGARHYLHIADRFPDIPVSLSEPEPWANLVYLPDKAKPLTPEPPDTYWGQIALLELVRTHPDPDMTVSAFDRLFTEYPIGPSHGFALKAMLNRPEFISHALPGASVYLNGDHGNPYLARQIKEMTQKGPQ